MTLGGFVFPNVSGLLAYHCHNHCHIGHKSSIKGLFSSRHPSHSDYCIQEMAVGGAFPCVVGLVLEEFYDEIRGDTAHVIGWLRNHGLLARVMQCTKCGGPTRQSVLRSNIDRTVWRCEHRPCRHKINIRSGSFFQGSHLTLKELTQIIYLWSQGLNVTDVTIHVKVTGESVVQWFQYLRDLCSWDLINNPRPIGGAGHIVAIDESLMARRKRGNAQGRPVREKWVFGGVDLRTKEFFMEFVERRDAATLVPIIMRNILPGTTIWSDEWRAYGNLGNIANYQHQRVNHSLHYVDPVTGVHTNNIEARWNACKLTFRRKCGVLRRHYPSHLDEYMWRKRREVSEIFSDILAVARRRYPV